MIIATLLQYTVTRVAIIYHLLWLLAQSLLLQLFMQCYTINTRMVRYYIVLTNITCAYEA